MHISLLKPGEHVPWSGELRGIEVADWQQALLRAVPCFTHIIDNALVSVKELEMIGDFHSARFDFYGKKVNFPRWLQAFRLVKLSLYVYTNKGSKKLFRF